MPLEGVVALVLALIFVTLTLIASGIAKFIPGLLLTGSVIAAIIAFAFRAELPFLVVILQGRFIEPRRVTSETRSRL